MKKTCTLAVLFVAALTSGDNIFAQNTFPASGRVGIYTTSPVASLQVLGGARIGRPANYVNIDSATGNLSFGGNAALRIAGNRYAFQYSGDPDYGLFFNSTNVRYEFRDGAAIPVFYVNANTGNSVFSGTVTVGNYTLPTADGGANQVLKTNGAGVLSWANDNNTTYTAGTGLNLVGTTFNNTAPDQVVSLSGSNGISVSGAYPNFTINGANFWRTTGNSGLNEANNFLGTTDAVDLVFRAGNIEGMRLDNATRRLGLGTISPTAKLHVNSAALEDALRVQTNGTTRLFVNADGNMGINTLSPEANLHVFRGSAGAVTANGNSPLVVENNTSNFISLLTPDANEKGILFGDATDNSDGGIIYNSSNSMQFRTNGNTTRMTLNSLGDLNISGDLDVSGSTVGFGSVEQISDIGAFLIGTNSDFANETDGVNNSIGTSAQRWVDVWAVDGTINTSDAREKNSIRDLNYGLKEILKLHAVRFKWNKRPEAGEKLGVIAQEVQKVIPEAVWDHEYVRDEKTREMKKVPTAVLGLNYDALIPVIIRGMQQQQQIIEEQNKKIELLTRQMDILMQQQQAITDGSSSTDLITVAPASAEKLRVVPNPAKAQISITGLHSAGALKIMDMQGRPILQQAVTAKTASVNIGNLAAGSYIIQYIYNGKTQTQKFIKE